MPLLSPTDSLLTHDEAAARALIVECARSYIDCRYRHRGRTREHGIDCLGLLVCVATDLGCEFLLKETDDDYGMNPDGYYLVERLSECLDEIPVTEAAAGDIVLCRWHIARPPQHIGIVTLNEPDNLRCVHSSRTNRKVVENRWATGEVTHAFRLRELAEVCRG
jgi:cell wall-associated NlpC family hydrolase